MGGRGLRAPSWLTHFVYDTGWKAKWRLALFLDGPRDATYIVMPHSTTKFKGPKPADKKVDTYIPGLILPGGGIEYKFPSGTRPGTVFGPMPLPTGNRSYVL